jgi:hypothetical protein
MAVGLILLYRGYAIARMGIVALVVGAARAVPMLWDVFSRVRPAPSAGVGMADVLLHARRGRQCGEVSAGQQVAVCVHDDERRHAGGFAR